MEAILKGKAAIVTGASRGIGAAIARALASNGAQVVINYLKQKDAAEGVLKEIKEKGGKGMTAQADVTDRSAVEAMAASAIKEFGKIDVLVNNANIYFPVKPFIELGWDELEAKITGEMKALYNCSRAVLDGMLKRGSGKIIMVSSGLSRHPGCGFSAHAAAKAAMDSLARVMAAELGPSGVTVNVIGPGLVRTDATAGLPEEMRKAIAQATPLKRIGEPRDIAGAAVFLSSSLSDYMTGEYLPVNGGSFMI